MATYFLVTFMNGDFKIGQIMPCTKKGRIRIGRSEHPVTDIEVIERIPEDIVEEIYNLVHNKKINERDVKKKVKELLMINKRPSFVFAFYNDEWGYDIYIGYIENSLR